MQDHELYLGEHPTLAILKNPPSGSALDIANFEPTVREPVHITVNHGSRRRKLWDLAAHCHCPIVGLCLSMAALRKLAGRVLDGDLPEDDYELHVTAVNECRRRAPLAESLQKELDQRYATAIRKLNTVKDSEALHEHWRTFIACNEMPAGLWACMTHPRCDAGMMEKIYREVHMLQHQASAATRDKDGRYQALAAKHACCLQDIERSRRRYQRLQVEKAAEVEALNAEILRLRNDNAAKENSIKQLQEELEYLHRQAEELDSRMELAEQVRWLSGRNQELMQRIVDMRRNFNPGAGTDSTGRHATARTVVSTDAGVETGSDTDTAVGPVTGSTEFATGTSDDGNTDAATIRHLTPEQLDSRAVLCVGGRHAAISVYRRIVEKKGGRFIHHDGGREDSVHRLDASLAAADLVICQAGCISHSAYWLVKDHCKRTGKRCVYVDKPSASAFERGLIQSVRENIPTQEKTEV
ncbi:MAG: DUF2325 domain-containing protein [Lautropia sp.]|nr:DUF2325 domain-containing protein [Lautropia sp.]